VSIPPRIYAADVQSPPDTSDFYYRALSTLETKIHFKINYLLIPGVRAHVHTGFFPVREDNGTRDELLLIDYAHRRSDYSAREKKRARLGPSHRVRGQRSIPIETSSTCMKIGCYREHVVQNDREPARCRLGVARHGSARLGSARLGSARLDAMRCDARPDAARRGTATLLSTARS